MDTLLKIGTRGSELARRQTQFVQEALQQLSPTPASEAVIIQTAGDQRTDIPLCDVNRATNTQDKGVFIAALEEALAAGKIDIAVHSLKDMPGQLDERFEIAAVLPRECINDVLVLREGADLERLNIGTSSVRRVREARCYWGHRAHCFPLRGNVATRLQKLVQQDNPPLDGIILAKAGLRRLQFPESSFEVEGTRLSYVDLSLGAFMPALGQGAIAIEIRREDKALHDMLRCINHVPTELCTRCERHFLRLLDANCSVPVGGYAELQKDAMILRALYFMEDGTPIRVSQRGSATDPEGLALSAFNQLDMRLRH